MVESRGHRISDLKSLPLVVSNSVCETKTTKDAMKILKAFNLEEEVKRVKDSKTVRAGKGKWRNRRYRMKKGVLLIHHDSVNVERSFRNVPGVDLMHIDRLNILELAPGGHLGRLILWTQDAFVKLGPMFGKLGEESALKKGYSLPANIVTDDDVEGVFYSEEVQALLKTPNLLNCATKFRSPEVISKLNPYLDWFRPEDSGLAHCQRGDVLATQ
jgi:large subunit ribosomal protein L4e